MNAGSSSASPFRVARGKHRSNSRCHGAKMMQISRALRAFGYFWLYSPLVWRWFAPPAETLLPVGSRGEILAERWLLQRGYQILARNHQTRYAEIDLIAVDGRTVVFIEVKTRKDLRAGSPVEAVDEEKQLRLSRAAVAYLRKHHLKKVAVRFDVIAVDFSAGNARPNLKHYRSAFESALPD